MAQHKYITTPTNVLADAIAAEARDWAEFFEVTDPADLEARERVMRANARAGYYEPLKGYYTGA